MSRMRGGGWILPAILGLALGLRCIGLASRGIIYDDAFSILLAERSLSEIVSGTAADTMPPLFYFLLHFWMQVSRELWFIRLLPISLNLATIAILYSLASRLMGVKGGRWTALIAAVMPLQLYHAQDVRMYALVLFFETAYAWFFFSLWIQDDTASSRSGWDWLGLILSGTGALYSHNLAVFGLAAANVILLTRRRWRGLAQLLAAQLVMGILFIPWLVMLPGQIQKIQTAFWTPRPGVVEVLQAMIQFGPNLPLPGALLGVGTGLAVLLVVVTALETWRDRKQTPNLDFLAAYALSAPVLLFVVSYLMRPVFVARGFLVAAIGVYALAGRILARSHARGAAWLLLGIASASAALGLYVHVTFAEFPRSPFREAAAVIDETIPDGTLLLHDNKLSAFPMIYFAPEQRQAFLADEPGSANDTLARGTQIALQLFAAEDAESAAAGEGDLVFVVFSETLNEYRLLETAHPALSWLEQNFTLVEQTTINDLELYHFTRP